MQRFSWHRPFVRASTFVNNLFLNTVDIKRFFDTVIFIFYIRSNMRLCNYSHLVLVATFVSTCIQISITLPLDNESNLIDIDPIPCHAEALKVSNFR